MNGDIGIPSNSSTIDGSVPFSGSTIFLNEINELRNYKTFLGAFTSGKFGWQNIISVRHRNGCGDGVNYGMYIRAPLTANGNLYWDQNIGTVGWVGERTIMDSGNIITLLMNISGTNPGANHIWCNTGTRV